MLTSPFSVKTDKTDEVLFPEWPWSFPSEGSFSIFSLVRRRIPARAARGWCSAPLPATFRLPVAGARGGSCPGPSGSRAGSAGEERGRSGRGRGAGRGLLGGRPRSRLGRSGGGVTSAPWPAPGPASARAAAEQQRAGTPAAPSAGRCLGAASPAGGGQGGSARGRERGPARGEARPARACRRSGTGGAGWLPSRRGTRAQRTWGQSLPVVSGASGWLRPLAVWTPRGWGWGRLLLLVFFAPLTWTDWGGREGRRWKVLYPWQTFEGEVGDADGDADSPQERITCFLGVCESSRQGCQDSPLNKPKFLFKGLG